MFNSYGSWNVAAIGALASIGRLNESLALQQQQLSSGDQVSSPADGPSAYTQLSQLFGSSSSASTVSAAAQTDSTAFKTVTSSLGNITLQLDTIQNAVADATANSGNATADQTTIENAVQSIYNIAQSTTFGGRSLLNGSASSGASVINNGLVNSISLNAAQGTGVLSTGNVSLTVISAANTATVNGAVTYASVNSLISTANGGANGPGGTITINGQNITVQSTDTVQTLINSINAVSNQTNVTAQFITSGGSGYIQLEQQTAGANYGVSVSETANLLVGTNNSNLVKPTYASTSSALGAAPTITDPNSINALSFGDAFGGADLKPGSISATVDTAATQATVGGNKTFASTSSTLFGGGTIKVNNKSITVTNGETVSSLIAAINADTGTTGVTASFVSANGSGYVQLQNQSYGSAFSVTLKDNSHYLDSSTNSTATGVNAVVSVTANSGTTTDGTPTTVTFTGGQLAGNNGLQVSDGNGNYLTLTAAGNTTNTVNDVVGNVSGSTVTVGGTQFIFSGAETVADLITQVNSQSGATGVTASFVANGGSHTIELLNSSNNTVYGISQANAGGLVAYVNPPSATNGSDATAVATVNIVTATGLATANITFTGPVSDPLGPSVSLSDGNGDFLSLTPAGNNTSTNETNVGETTGPDIFQTGAEAGMFSYTSLPSALPTALGTSVSPGLSVASIDVTTPSGLANAASIVKAALNQVAIYQAQVGGYNQSVLNSTANDMGTQSTAESTAASSIQDVNYNTANTNFSNLQSQLQNAGSALYSFLQSSEQYVALLV